MSTENGMGMLHQSLRSGVLLRELDDSTIVLESRRSLRVTGLSPGVKAALLLLASSEVSEHELCEEAERIDGNVISACRVIYYLWELTRRGLLDQNLKSGTRLLATVQGGISDNEPLAAQTMPSDTPLVLSRFACLRQENSEAIIESPLAGSRIVIKDGDCFNTIFGLMQPRTCEELLALTPAHSRGEVRSFLTLLYVRRIVRGIGDDDAGDARYWEFHDLVFHARTRLWQDGYPVGATFRFGCESAPITLPKPHSPCTCIELYRPDIHALMQNDTPFTEVMERRRSLRGPSEHMISGDQLGEFLFRVARIRSATGQGGAADDLKRTDRPYPNAGGCYELELYVLIARCEGIPGGFYHYRPDSHQLCTIAADEACLSRILHDAQAAAQTLPQVVLIVAASFPRIAWKYEGIAYSLILKDVGVLFQTMYLVATAMRLMPCAVGAGDSWLFARATGIDRLAESSVGEFILTGSMSCER